MKAIVGGGRHFGRVGQSVTTENAKSFIDQATQERAMLVAKLDEFQAKTPITLLICGHEGGAERLARAWAEAKQLKTLVVSRRGRETIIARNQRMLNDTAPDVVITFGSGEATLQLIEDAKQKGLTTYPFC